MKTKADQPTRSASSLKPSGGPARAALYIVCGLLVLAAGVYALNKGRFSLRSKSISSYTVTREGDPYLYWLGTGTCFLLGLALVSAPFLPQRQQRQSGTVSPSSAPGKPRATYTPEQLAANRAVFEKDIVRAKRNFGRGMILMGMSLLLLGVMAALYQHRNMDIFGWVLFSIMAACPLIGLALIGRTQYLRCPGCRERVVLGRGQCRDFCQTCGGQIVRHDTGEGLFRITTYQCSGCGMKPRSQQAQNIGSIHHCPHCGLKLLEK